MVSKRIMSVLIITIIVFTLGVANAEELPEVSRAIRAERVIPNCNLEPDGTENANVAWDTYVYDVNGANSIVITLNNQSYYPFHLRDAEGNEISSTWMNENYNGYQKTIAGNIKYLYLSLEKTNSAIVLGRYPNIVEPSESVGMLEIPLSDITLEQGMLMMIVSILLVILLGGMIKGKTI